MKESIFEIRDDFYLDGNRSKSYRELFIISELFLSTGVTDWKTESNGG